MGGNFVCFAHCDIPASTMVPTSTQVFVEGIHGKISDTKVHAFHDKALPPLHLDNLAETITESCVGLSYGCSQRRSLPKDPQDLCAMTTAGQVLQRSVISGLL